MTHLSWVRWLGVLLAVAVCVPDTCAQIFPFSNLKHVFKAKPGGAKATPSPVETTTASTTPEPATTTTLAPYFGPYALLDDDGGYRHYVKPSSKAAKPAKHKPAKLAKQHAEESQQYPQHAPRPPGTAGPPGAYGGGPHKQPALRKQAAHQPAPTSPASHHAKRPSHLVPLKIAAAESSAVSLGGPRAPPNHRTQPRPAPPPPTHHQQHQHQQQHQRAPKYKNHKPAAGPTGPPRPVRYHNHKPGGLDEQESMTSLRYRKRPLSPLEQEVSATGLQHAGSHPGYAGLSDGDRVEFQMHGLQGPKSYKFGYDTGNGQNRQFRYEERDPHGNVKGHYGYVDEHGKLQVVNYKADSQGGYKADVSKLHT